MLKVKVKSENAKSRGSCKDSDDIESLATLHFLAPTGYAARCNDEVNHDISCSVSERFDCNVTQPRGLRLPTEHRVTDESTQKPFDDLSDMEACRANATSSQDELLPDTEEFQPDAAVPLGAINVEPMDDDQDDGEEQTFVEFETNEVMNDISEIAEVELPYLFSARDGRGAPGKLPSNVQYGDTDGNTSVFPPDGDTCRGNVVVEQILYEMPLLKSESVGADFERDALVRSYSSADVEVYPQGARISQWNIRVDDDAVQKSCRVNTGQSARTAISGGRFAMEKQRTITIKDVTNRGRAKRVSHAMAGPCPSTSSGATGTIVILSPKSMTPLQVQHPTLTQLLGPLVASVPTSAFNQPCQRSHCPRSDVAVSHTPSTDVMVPDVTTLPQLVIDDSLAVSESRPAVCDVTVIENIPVAESLQAGGSVTITSQRVVSSIKREDVVCSSNEIETTSVTEPPEGTNEQHTLSLVAPSVTGETDSSQPPQREEISIDDTLSPETNKALKLLLSKVSHEQQREINVVGRVVDSCSDIEKPPETLADRYMRNWKQTGQFQCKFCPYSSVTRNYLYRHWMANHSAVTPYQCRHCDMKASSRDVITRHQTLTHRSSTKDVLVDFTLEQHSIDQFYQMFDMSTCRDRENADGAAIECADAKKVKTINLCSPVDGAARTAGFICSPVVEMRTSPDIITDNPASVCSTPVAQPPCKSQQISPTNTALHEPVSHSANTETLATEQTNVVIRDNLSDNSPSTFVLSPDACIDLTSGDSATICGVSSALCPRPEGPKPEHLQEQMMAALHSNSNP